MMGCGKSSVGRELSRLLSLPFVDLDDYIEKREGRSIRDIFGNEGEAAFRNMELEALKEILSNEADAERSKHEAAETATPKIEAAHIKTGNMILALGGGTLTTPECAALVAEHTFCIYLKTSADELSRRLESEAAHRPMLKANKISSDTHRQQLYRRITRLLSQREPLYEKTARRTIATDGLSISQIAAAIYKLPNESITIHRTESPQITE